MVDIYIRRETDPRKPGSIRLDECTAESRTRPPGIRRQRNHRCLKRERKKDGRKKTKKRKQKTSERAMNVECRAVIRKYGAAIGDEDIFPVKRNKN